MLRKLAVIYAAVSFVGAMLVSEPSPMTSTNGGAKRVGIEVGSGDSSSTEKNSIAEAQVMKRRVVRVPRVPIGKILLLFNFIDCTLFSIALVSICDDNPMLPSMLMCLNFFILTTLYIYTF
jgi:hypothetical protein